MINVNVPMAERRRFIRHPLCIPLSYKLIKKGKADSAKEKGAETINISQGGLLFPASRSVNAGSTIMLKLPFQDEILNLKARVVHCEKNPETQLYNIGVSFSRMGDAFKVKLREQAYLITAFRDLWSMQRGKEVSLEEASREWIKRYSEKFRKLYW